MQEDKHKMEALSALEAMERAKREQAKSSTNVFSKLCGKASQKDGKAKEVTINRVQLTINDEAMQKEFRRH